MTIVSVVIISKNERGLDDTLDALASQCVETNAEIVVVDASDGALDDIAHRHPGVRWIPFASSGKRITIPEQRNVGVQEAAGEIIVFTDSGCVPRPGWLAALTAPILSGDEDVVSGGVRSRTGDSVYDAMPPEPAAGYYVEECPTINLAFTKRAFYAVGGFDESFDYGSDVDLSWRWRDAGYRILRLPDAMVHSDWGSSRRQAKRSFLWGAARARLYTKHRHRLRQVPQHDPMLLLYPAFLLGLPLTILVPYYPLLLLVPLWRNRHHRPAQVVADHLIYGVGVLWQLGRAVTR